MGGREVPELVPEQGQERQPVNHPGQVKSPAPRRRDQLITHHRAQTENHESSRLLYDLTSVRERLILMAGPGQDKRIVGPSNDSWPPSSSRVIDCRAISIETWST